MANNEQPVEIDVDAMSDEELDSFLEEHTGLDAEAMNNSDVVDDPDTPSDEIDAPKPEEEEEPAGEEESSTEEDSSAEEGADVDVDVDSTEETPEEDPAPQIDLDKYEAQELATMTEVYEELFKTGIKASGIKRTIRDPEHLKTLVRIGFSANENNRRIKPYLRQLKSLEQAGVSLEDDNLNFLVDVMSGNKDAIKELVKNRLQLDEEELQSWYEEEGGEKEYTPQNHMISDSRLRFEEVLEEIRPTETYAKTVEFITSIDDDGKALISENPELVKLLNEDMQKGYFQKALDEAYYRMDRGLLPKQSILQSYVNVMQDETFYRNLVGQSDPQAVEEQPAPAEQKKRNREVVNRKKKASNVGTSQGAAKRSSQQQFKSKDIAKMSEEEFEDFYNSLDIDD
jgi:hypothetical protein